MGDIKTEKKKEFEEVFGHPLKQFSSSKESDGVQNNPSTAPDRKAADSSKSNPAKRAKQNNNDEAVSSSEVPNSKDIDEASVIGRFGWHTLSQIHIPYIIRGSESYCAVRMVELKLLNRYLTYLNTDIYNCICIRSYYITEAESRLLNEINIKHCDSQFGTELFSTHDLVVRLTDADEFCTFLMVCYNKLMQRDTISVHRCGFIRINNESIVPYTLYKGAKYVPLFYFEGETDNLRKGAEKLENWDLAYLKFCCKVQGIRNELFSSDSCTVISLNSVKNYFPPGTVFDDFWPKKTTDSALLVTDKNRQANVQWIRQPVGAPIPSIKPVSQTNSMSNNQLNMYQGYRSANYKQANTATRSAYPTTTATRPVRASYYNATAATQQSLIRAAQPQRQPPLLLNSKANSTNYGVLGWQNAQQQSLDYQGNDISNNFSTPPPLVIRHLNGDARFRHSPAFNSNTNNFMGLGEQTGYQQQMSGRYPPPLVDTRHLSNGEMSSRERQVYSSLSNNQTTHPQTSTSEEPRQNNNSSRSVDNSKGHVIPETSRAYLGYQMHKALVTGKLIECINMTAFEYTELLVTLPDLIKSFYTGVTLEQCKQVMTVMGIDMFEPNRSQLNILKENGKVKDNETVSLVQVRNIIDFMPQLRYMMDTIISNNMSVKANNS